MTLFNGSESCITSEGYEYIGTIVSRGKGHSRCFPHRLEDERFPLRTDESVRKTKKRGTDKKRCKGFKGKAGLFTLKGFNTVEGMIPYQNHFTFYVIIFMIFFNVIFLTTIVDSDCPFVIFKLYYLSTRFVNSTRILTGHRH